MLGMYVMYVCFMYVCCVCMLFTTRTPAVPDVLGSGRNDGALRPGRCVRFR